jgi:two-component system response regulator AtoC
VLVEGDVLLPEHFPSKLGQRPGKNAPDMLLDGFSLKTAQKMMEEKLITRALKETGGNRTQAARLLEISHPSLLSKIKTYKIDL